MAIQEGDKLPEATLHIMSGDRPKAVTTADLFAGKKVVAFAVPGAFTPGCSQVHLPGYVVNADKLKAKGVDSIVCISVNDAFVDGQLGAGPKRRGAGHGRGRQRRLHSGPWLGRWTPAALAWAPVRSATP